MARTAKVQRLTALAVKRYANDHSVSAPLHDGGGLYLRKRDASALWYLRLTEPATGAQKWHRMFPHDPLGGYPHRSLLDARAEAKRLWDLRSEGTDPRALRLKTIATRRQADLDEAAAAKRKVTFGFCSSAGALLTCSRESAPTASALAAKTPART